MLKVFDFKCDQGHVFEDFVSSNVTVSRCDCGANAIKIPSATKCQLDGASGDFPGQHMKWVREHEAAGKLNRTPQG